jgi:hypothetical protein
MFLDDLACPEILDDLVYPVFLDDLVYLETLVYLALMLP